MRSNACPNHNGIGNRGFHIFNANLEVHHLGLLASLLRPGGRLVPLLRLEEQGDVTGGIGQGDPTLLMIRRNLPAEQLAVELRHFLGISTVEGDTRSLYERAIRLCSRSHCASSNWCANQHICILLDVIHIHAA
jgi:hypothetical protein